MQRLVWVATMRRMCTSTLPGLAGRHLSGLGCSSRLLLGTVVPFKLSDIGEGTLEVQILKWLVKPGDEIKAFDKLCEIQTDKATDTISSAFDGTVRTLHAEVGGVALVGKPLVDIETDDQDVIKKLAGSAKAGGAAPAASTAATSTPSAAAGAAAAASSAADRGAKPLATPAVRRISKENNVDLRNVPATGKGGRVTKDDILAFIAGGGKAPAAVAAATTGVTRAADRVEVIAGVKKAMVKSMTQALKIPAFGAKDEIEMNKLIAARDELRPIAKARNNDIKLSFMPFFLKAASLALTRYDTINAHTNEDCTQVTYRGAHNIGFAMDTPTGLIVPNVKDVQDKSIMDIALDMHEIMERGRRSALTKADLSDGTLTLSNIGSIGATYAMPVIFPPQVAIGALGRMLAVPRFDANDNVVKAHIINVSWAADHRVVDGATMVRFGNAFKAYLEAPTTMLLDTK